MCRRVFDDAHSPSDGVTLLEEVLDDMSAKEPSDSSDLYAKCTSAIHTLTVIQLKRTKIAFEDIAEDMEVGEDLECEKNVRRTA